MRSLLLLLALLAPASAHAQYLSPEEVLLRDRNALYVPTSPRAAQENAAKQEAQRNVQSYPTVTDWWDRPATEPAPEVVPADPAPDAEHSGPPLTDTESTDDAVYDPVTARWLRRLQQQQSETSYDGPPLYGSTLSSTNRRPLAGTGPAETATVIVMAGAIGWTLWRSRRMRQLV